MLSIRYLAILGTREEKGGEEVGKSGEEGGKGWGRGVKGWGRGVKGWGRGRKRVGKREEKGGEEGGEERETEVGTGTTLMFNKIPHTQELGSGQVASYVASSCLPEDSWSLDIGELGRRGRRKEEEGGGGEEREIHVIHTPKYTHTHSMQGFLTPTY